MDMIDQLPDDRIASTARDILLTYDQAIYLSRLGQDLGKTLGVSIKQVLGSRRLGDFIKEHLGEEFQVWGEGPYKRVGRQAEAEAEGASKPRVMFDPVVWKAFSTPIPEGSRRWLSTITPVSVFDSAQQQASESLIEVTAADIVGAVENQADRGAAIASAIKAWRGAHDVPQEALAFDRPKPRVTAAARPKGEENGLTALKLLVSTIPEAERSKYSLPLNLIGRLLQVR
jgi:hypothetical protein